ncbi:MAG TPA: LptA/OstA family protein [Oscillatoriaceae cyanobacterium]
MSRFRALMLAFAVLASAPSAMAAPGKPTPATPAPAKPVAATPTPSKPTPRPSTKPSQPPVKAVKGKIHIVADYMKYDRDAKTALANGNVVIYQDDITIDTAEVQFDQAQKVSYMNKPVHLVQKKVGDPPTTLDAKSMTDYHKEQHVVAQGDVHMVRSKDPYAKPTSNTQNAKIAASIKKDDTVITSDTLDYWTDNKNAKFTGHVIIENGQKKSWSDSAMMDHVADTTTLDGNVKMVQINGNWLVRDHIVKADNPDEARDEALHNPATLTADHVVIDQKTNNAVATGQIVRVEQKGKVATGKKAVFDDHDHTITMTEDVRIQQANGDWLTATKAVFHTNTEVFEAFSGGGSQVHTEFSVPGNAAPSPTPSGGRVQMDFDVNKTKK